MPFRQIMAPKLDRFLAARFLAIPFLFAIAILQSIVIILRFRPEAMVSAGSYVAVPLAYVARVFGIPVVLHQMDISPGLANRLMKSVAAVITVSVAGLEKSFPGKRAVHTGIPVRREIIEAFENRPEFSRRAEERFNLDPSRPTLLVVGGGTGSLQLNRLVETVIERLAQIANVIHVTGLGKAGAGFAHARYKIFPLLGASEAGEALAAADFVVSRAGMGFISELVAMEKPFLLIPLPDSHQEKNAEFFNREAGIPVLGKKVTPEEFFRAVSGYLQDPRSWPGSIEKLRALVPANATRRLSEIVLGLDVSKKK